MLDVKFEELKGKTLANVENKGDEVIFTTETGEVYKLYHLKDCCESVTVEDVCGDLYDLIGSPLVEAEEETGGKNLYGGKKEYQDSFTWTFYKLRTAKGAVTIRWYGESNGYYSTSVDFARVA